MTYIDKLTPVIVRIIMRYLAGAGVTAGVLVLDDTQALVTIGVSAALGAVAEIWMARVTKVRQ